MYWLTQQYPLIKEYLIGSVPNYWTEFAELFNDLWERNQLVSPEVLIPMCTCKAIGGKPEDAVAIVAGLIPVFYRIKILSDLKTENKEGLWKKIGSERTFNFADSFQTLSHKILGDLPYSKNIKTTIYNTFLEGTFLSFKGENRILQGCIGWDDYWKNAELKTAFFMSTVAAMGAMVGTSSKKKIDACRVYGYHLGLALHILNDFDGVWNTEEDCDLNQGKVTLPIIYGLNCKNPYRKELYNLVVNKTIKANKSKILTILDKIEAKKYMVWAALQEKEKAIKALKSCADKEAVKMLEHYLNGVFGDIDEMLKRNLLSKNKDMSNFHQRTLIRKQKEDDKLILNSTGLAIRSSLRDE